MIPKTLMITRNSEFFSKACFSNLNTHELSLSPLNVKRFLEVTTNTPQPWTDSRYSCSKYLIIHFDYSIIPFDYLITR